MSGHESEVVVEGAQNNQAFWESEAQKLPWSKKWDKVLEWKEPFAHWFVGGQINASYACLDVHVVGEDKNRIAKKHTA